MTAVRRTPNAWGERLDHRRVRLAVDGRCGHRDAQAISYPGTDGRTRRTWYDQDVERQRFGRHLQWITPRIGGVSTPISYTIDFVDCPWTPELGEDGAHGEARSLVGLGCGAGRADRDGPAFAMGIRESRKQLARSAEARRFTRCAGWAGGGGALTYRVQGKAARDRVDFILSSDFSPGGDSQPQWSRQTRAGSASPRSVPSWRGVRSPV